MCYDKLSDEERIFVDYLGRGIICDIIRSDEVDTLIGKEIIMYEEDLYDVQKDAERFLTHNYNARCLVRMPDG